MPSEPLQLGLGGEAVPVVTRGGRPPLTGECAAAAHGDGTQTRLFEPVDVLAGQQSLAVDTVAECQETGS